MLYVRTGENAGTSTGRMQSEETNSCGCCFGSGGGCSGGRRGEGGKHSARFVLQPAVGLDEKPVAVEGLSQ